MNNFSDDYLKKVFQHKLKDFEPEASELQGYTIPQLKRSSRIIVRRGTMIASITFLLLVTSATSNREFQEPSSVANSIHGIYLLNQKEPVSDSFNREDASRQFAEAIKLEAIQVSEVRESVPDKEANEPSRAKSVVINRLYNTALNRPLFRIDSLISKLKVQGVIMDSRAKPMPKQALESISRTRRFKQSNPIELTVGMFVNSNHYSPAKNDGHFIRSFRQDNNIFMNRIGVEIVANYRALRAPYFPLMIVRPTIKYKFLHKSYTFEKQSILMEGSGDFTTTRESQAYHFLGFGFNFSQSVFNHEVNIESTFIRTLNRSGYSFARSNIEFGLSTDIKSKSNSIDPLTISPFINYSIPINENNYFSTNMMSIGIRFKVF